MGVRLHQRPIFSPALPPVRGNERNVTGMAMCPTLEVVAVDECQALTRSLQYEEASEQPHRWPHPHEHLTEVDEDGHQHNRVGREVLQLEVKEMSASGRRIMDLYAGFHPLFILPYKRQPIRCGASCPHRAHVIPRR
jgi:hypothetical protein